MPGASIDGIEFYLPAGDITIDANTGAFGITTTGGGLGIYAFVGGSGDITVTSTGDIDADGGGIFARVGDVGDITVTSTGDIDSVDEGIYARVVDDGDIMVTSTGNITSEFNDGIFAKVDFGDIMVTSTGDIESVVSDGINAEIGGSGNISITSTGNITSNGNGGIATRVGGNGDIMVTSTGDIDAGEEGITAYVGGDGNITITSTGDIVSPSNDGINARVDGNGNISITSTGDIVSALAGIYVFHDGTGTIAITTTGSVTSRDGIVVAARANNDTPTTINNSAVITGTDGIAINFLRDGNDTLNLQPGSVLVGVVDFGNSNDGMGGTNPNDIDTLNAAPGLNGIVATFPDLESAPEIVSSNVAVIAMGKTAVAVDPSGFAASGAFLGSLTTSIANTLGNNTGSGFDPQVIPASYSPQQQHVNRSAQRAWVAGFGGVQKVVASSSNVELDNLFGGIVTGVETASDYGTIGVFGGYARNSIDLDFGAGDVDIDSYFGGIYWNQDFGSHQIKFSLIGGSANHETVRSGVGTVARGDFDGWFISPSLTVAAPVELLPVATVASIRVSYSGLFLDGYTETGTGALLSVDDRDVHLFNTRGQLAFPINHRHSNGSRTHLEGRVGIDAQFDAGSDNVVAGIIGSPGASLNFSANLDDEISGFAGLSISHTSADGSYSLSAATELKTAFDGGYQATGDIRASLNF